MKENIVTGMENELFENRIDTYSSDFRIITDILYWPKNKISSWFGSYMNEDEEYKTFKNQVAAALEGEDFGREIYEVPISELEKEGVWGMNYENKAYIPRLRDIPKVLGTIYDSIIERIVGNSRSNTTKEGIKRGIQTYIKLHELFENIYGINSQNGEEHAEYESILGRALSELAAEGNEKADDAYKGMLATYWKRFNVGDWFAKKVEKYFPKIWSDAISLVPEYAKVEVR